jgi:mono/diheme cytochrome c family protein
MRSLAALVLTASLAVNIGCGPRGSAATTMDHMGDMGSTRTARPENHKATAVHSISLPHDEAFAPPGPGREAFVTACVVCHSPRYITSQPPFSREVWKGVVHKMIDTYGAHITEAQAAEIVDYLVATNGATSIGEKK